MKLFAVMFVFVSVSAQAASTYQYPDCYYQALNAFKQHQEEVFSIGPNAAVAVDNTGVREVINGAEFGYAGPVAVTYLVSVKLLDDDYSTSNYTLRVDTEYNDYNAHYPACSVTQVLVQQ